LIHELFGRVLPHCVAHGFVSLSNAMAKKACLRIEPSASAQPPATFGEFVTSVYDSCDRQKARGIVWLAVNAHLVEFRGRERYLISETVRTGSGM
jgi:hypothetical protein